MTSPKKSAPKSKFPLSVIPKAKKAPPQKTKSRAELEAAAAKLVVWVPVSKINGTTGPAIMSRQEARRLYPSSAIVRCELVVRGRRA